MKWALILLIVLIAFSSCTIYGSYEDSDGNTHTGTFGGPSVMLSAIVFLMFCVFVIGKKISGQL